MESVFKENEASAVCQNCLKLINEKRGNVICDGTIDKCAQWLDNCNLNDDESLCSDSTCSSSLKDVLSEDNISVVPSSGHNVCMTDKIINSDINGVVWDNSINKSSNHYRNIQVYKSQNVHIGNVTNINGSVYINTFAPKIKQTVVYTNSTNNNNIKAPAIVSRRTWLAQPPLDPEDVTYFSKPVKNVIISHTATEEAYTQTDNNLIVRLIQQFHIESRKWNDISYNFLIGADGSIYEGRGWKIVGAHTYGNNYDSIGISFIGCYMKTLPPPTPLEKAKSLIKYGVEIGAIVEDYFLLGACQLSSTESPGRRLFQEIKSWERWKETGKEVDQLSNF